MPVTPPKCYLEAPRTPIDKPKYPVIDAHNHLRRITDYDELLRRMDAFGIERIVDLDGGRAAAADHRNDPALPLEAHGAAHPDRLWIFTTVNILGLDRPDFAQNVRDFLRARRDSGVMGIKFFKTLGLRMRDSTGEIILPSDERLAPVWETAAELGMPVTIHIADPISFFDPVTPDNERYVELGEHPDWSFSDPALPRFHELLAAQEQLLAAHRKTKFIIAHVGSYAENLREVSRMLKAHPNMYTDTAERIAELGRQPYSARAFLIEHQDRVIYGTDLTPTRVNTDANYRFFETYDEYFQYNDWAEHNQGCWNIYGVGLPEDALKKIYRTNAEKVILGKA